MADKSDDELAKALQESVRSEEERKRQLDQEEIQLALAMQLSEQMHMGWDCEVCTFKNESSVQVCAVCQASKSAPEVARKLSSASPRLNGLAPAVDPSDFKQLLRTRTRYKVPTIEGSLSVTISSANDLVDKALVGKMDPYVEMRVLQPAYVGPLRITVHKATDLHQTQYFGKQDPYVIVTLHHLTERSQVCRNGDRNPVWEHTLPPIQLKGGEKERIVSLEVWNKGTMTDTFIGRVRMSVAALAKTAGQGFKWYNLGRDHQDRVPAGYLCVSVLADPALTPDAHQTLANKQTKVCKKGGIKPIWNETLQLHNVSSEVSLHFTVWSRNTVGSPSFLGQTAVIPVKNAVLQQYFSRSAVSQYPLGPRPGHKSKRLPQGNIEISIAITNAEHPMGLAPTQLDDRGDAVMNGPPFGAVPPVNYGAAPMANYNDPPPPFGAQIPPMAPVAPAPGPYAYASIYAPNAAPLVPLSAVSPSVVARVMSIAGPNSGGDRSGSPVNLPRARTPPINSNVSPPSLAQYAVVAPMPAPASPRLQGYGQYVPVNDPLPAAYHQQNGYAPPRQGEASVDDLHEIVRAAANGRQSSNSLSTPPNPNNNHNRFPSGGGYAASFAAPPPAYEPPPPYGIGGEVVDVPPKRASGNMYPSLDFLRNGSPPPAAQDYNSTVSPSAPPLM